MNSSKTLSVLLFLSVFFPFSACEVLEKAADSPQTQESPARVEATVPWKGQAIGADTFVKIAERAEHTIVNISASKKTSAQNSNPFFFGPDSPSPFEDFFGRDLFERFFRDRGRRPQPDLRQQGLGSGFLISEDGYIVTNNHVVANADEVTVTIDSKRQFKAEVVGTDPKTDVAVLKINANEKFRPLSLGDSESIRVGDIVVAIGNPFGLFKSVTQGIVSALGRDIGMGAYDDFIQTDASINPGNSGGPLLNLSGEVIGINTAIVASGQGIGFAIPIDLAKGIIAQLKENGSVKRGWLGVLIQQVDEDLAKSLGLDLPKGALVSDVQKDSPAEKAGMKPGDLILSFNGKDIEEYNDLPRIVASTKIGEKAKLKILRGGKEEQVEVVIGELSPEKEALPTKQSPSDSRIQDKKDLLGLMVQEIDEPYRRRMGLDSTTQGVWIRDLDYESPAAKKGLQVGDAIFEINRKPLGSLSIYQKEVSKLKKGDSVLLLISRQGGTPQFIAFTL